MNPTNILTQIKLLIVTQRPFADRLDQDQTEQNVQSDFESTLSDKEMFLYKNQVCSNSLSVFTMDLKVLFHLFSRIRVKFRITQIIEYIIVASDSKV